MNSTTPVVTAILLSGVATFLLATPTHGRDLEVGPGETLTVTREMATLRLENLFFGDHSTIRFAPALSYWNLTADSARIGEGVRIDARGQAGATGQDGTDSAPADECAEGVAGQPGTDGQPGGKGVNLELKLNVSALGSLEIDTRGGAGGNGGVGGQGQTAGRAGNCEPPAGGAGGDGGRGGRGGDGGNISLGLGIDSGTLPGQDTGIAELVQRIEFRTEAGAGGRGGEPGKGGAGAKGKYVKRKTLAGNVGWMPGGSSGQQGVSGADGSSGTDGRVIVSELPVRSPSREEQSGAGQPSGNSDRDTEIEALKTQLRLLQQRLEALEK